MALAGGYGAKFGANNYIPPSTPVSAPTGTAGQYGRGSNPGDMYNRRAEAQNQYGNPYGNPENAYASRSKIDQDWAGARYAAQMQQAQTQNNAWQDALWGMNDRWAQDQEGFINSGGALDQEYLDWQRGSLADDLNDANQNLAFRDQIIGNLQSMFGINDRALANQIAQSVLDEQIRANSAVYQARDQSQQLRSAGIAGGSMFFPGQKVGQGQIAEARDNTLRGIKEGANLTREGYNIAGEKERLGLQNQILGQQQTRLGEAGKVREANRAGQGFDIRSRQNQNKVAQELAQLRYKNTSDQMNQILDWLGRGNEADMNRAKAAMDRYRQTGGW